MRFHWRHALIAALVLAAALPLGAQPLTVTAGDDGWVTPSGGTQVDLSLYPLGGAFGSGVTLSPTLVPLTGVPINSTQLGSIDTIVKRSSTLTLPALNSTATTTVEIQALRLGGTVTASNGKTYSLRVCLSEWSSGTGTMTLKLTTPDGGSFNSSFPVLPKLVFTNVANSADKVIIDCGSVPGCPAFNLSAVNACWVSSSGPNHFSPSAKGITLIGAGIAVDGTCDGVADYTTVGTSNFFPGWDPHPPFPECVTQHDSSGAAKHVVKAPKDCAQTAQTAQTATATAEGTQKIALRKYCLQSATPTGTDSPTGADLPNGSSN